MSIEIELRAAAWVAFTENQRTQADLFLRALDRIEKLETRLKGLVTAFGTHACSGRDCIGIYAEHDSATQSRCRSCERARATILEDKP